MPITVEGAIAKGLKGLSVLNDYATAGEALVDTGLRIKNKYYDTPKAPTRRMFDNNGSTAAPPQGRMRSRKRTGKERLSKTGARFGSSGKSGPKRKQRRKKKKKK